MDKIKVKHNDVTRLANLFIERGCNEYKALEFAEAAIKLLRPAAITTHEPDYFYNADDWEYTHNSIGYVAEQLEPLCIMKVGRLLELNPVYAAYFPVADSDDVELRQFHTIEDAHAAVLKAKVQS
jgi:hypothetical protein